MVSVSQDKSEQLTVDQIGHLSDQEQAEKIADAFSSIQNEYDPLKSEDFIIP